MGTKPQELQTHSTAAKILRDWHERESWGSIARQLLDLPTGTPPRNQREKREISRVVALLSAQAREVTRSSEVMELLGMEPRVTPYYTIAFRFHSKEEFEKVKEAVDAQENRAQWLKKVALEE